jgi:hypothetical protein
VSKQGIESERSPIHTIEGSHQVETFKGLCAVAIYTFITVIRFIFINVLVQQHNGQLQN